MGFVGQDDRRRRAQQEQPEQLEQQQRFSSRLPRLPVPAGNAPGQNGRGPRPAL